MNKYLSSLSISSDHRSGPSMHVLAVGDIPELDPVPVSTTLAVDPSLAPSPVSPPHPPPEPASPVSTASDESSDDDLGFPGFRNYDDQEHESTDGINTETTAAQKPGPSTPSYFPSSSPKLPVSLPLDAREWTQILATHPAWNQSTTNDLVRVVEEDSKRLRYQRAIDRQREYNRQANIADLPLVPIPNLDGLKAPLVRTYVTCSTISSKVAPPRLTVGPFDKGYNNPITSVSQIKKLSTVELKAWLAHYGLSLTPDDSGQTRTRSLLATHLGVGTVLPA
ncbi:hypothetical protein M407DRAFT_208633 [Tulasnella calospora MUT 4182]|uniref:Uncharacterized protein n=1 Tax=Tulasnella calospora MUT 4182 TaxID=1051891 RepID=A0A0C3QIA4_9AGAM|nr:hypothetical protein M407DRAFT_208633 [Tulasnella calospora MUT 4182]